MNTLRALTHKPWVVIITGLVFFGWSLAASAWLISVSYTDAPCFCETDGYSRIAGKFACGDGESMLYRPLYPWLIVLMNSIAGSTMLYSGKLISALFGALFISGTFLVAYAHTKKYNIAVFGAMLTAINAQVLFNSTLACTDITCAFFILVAFHYTLNAIKPNSSAVSIMAMSVFCTLAVLVRVQAYFVVIALCLACVLLAKNSLRSYIKTIFFMVAGFILPMIMATMIDTRGGFSSTGIAWVLGIDHIASRIPEVINNFQGNTDATAGQPINIVLKYFLGIRLMADTVGYIPLLCLLAIPVYFQKAPRIFVVCALTAIFYFMGISWFPVPGHFEIKRLYLIYVPLLNVAFGIALYNNLFKFKKPFFKGRMFPVWFFIASIVVSWIVFPRPILKTAYKKDRSSILTRTSTGPSVETVTAANVAFHFNEKYAPGCKQVIVTSIGSTGVFKNVNYKVGKDFKPYRDVFMAAVNEKANSRAPKYLLTDIILPSAWYPPGWLITFTQLDTYGRFAFYDISVERVLLVPLSIDPKDSTETVKEN